MGMLGRSFPQPGPFWNTKNRSTAPLGYANFEGAPGGQTPGLANGPGGTIQRTGFVAQRPAVRRTRAHVGANANLPNVPFPGTYQANNNWTPQGNAYGGEGIFTYFNGGRVQTVQPAGTVKQRLSTQCHRSVTGHTYGQGYLYGTVNQPLTSRQPRRTSTRVYWRSGQGQGYLYGTINQPKQAIPHQRDPRQRSRAVIRNVGQGQSYLYGIVNQPLTSRQPRRTSSRAVVRTGQGQGYLYGTVNQPQTTRQPRRKTARSVTSHVYGQGYVFGQIQPRATISIPRRKSSRAVVSAIAGPPQGYVPATPPAYVYSNLSPGCGAGEYSTTNFVVTVFGPAGTVQPEPTRQPRRTSARVVWRGTTPTYSYYTGGQTQPRTTIPVPRRTSTRAVVHSIQIYSYFTGGKTQPLTTRQPRRVSSRAWVAHSQVDAGEGTTTDLYNGSVQPRATVPIPRRIHVRAVTRSQGSTTNLYNGTVQALTTRQPRRTSARVVTRNTQIYSYFTGGTVQPRATVSVPRRTASRAVIHSVATYTYFTGGQVQPKTTVAVPRRTSSRAYLRTINGQGYLFGKVNQPLTTRQPRRTSARAFVKFTPVTTVNAQPPPNPQGFPFISWMHRTGGRANPPPPTTTIVSR